MLSLSGNTAPYMLYAYVRILGTCCLLVDVVVDGSDDDDSDNDDEMWMMFDVGDSWNDEDGNNDE